MFWPHPRPEHCPEGNVLVTPTPSQNTALGAVFWHCCRGWPQNVPELLLSYPAYLSGDLTVSQSNHSKSKKVWLPSHGVRLPVAPTPAVGQILISRGRPPRFPSNHITFERLPGESPSLGERNKEDGFDWGQIRVKEHRHGMRENVTKMLRNERT